MSVFLFFSFFLLLLLLLYLTFVGCIISDTNELNFDISVSGTYLSLNKSYLVQWNYITARVRFDKDH